MLWKAFKSMGEAVGVVDFDTGRRARKHLSHNTVSSSF